MSDSGISENSGISTEMASLNIAGNMSENIPSNPMVDIEAYIQKMNDYVQHMKMLESRNAALEAENGQFKEENDVLRRKMNQIVQNPQSPGMKKPINSNDLSLKPGAIAAKLRKDFL
jgi:predicted RNase H-like nuclease (RuvC/YqgF family)